MDGPAPLGAVEVDDVYRLGPLTLPLPGAFDRVRIVLFTAAEIPLLQPHAPAAAQVYCRKDGEGKHSTISASEVGWLGLAVFGTTTPRR